ncbi:TadE/TadG family type IV pilus assembly protein [Vibrio splendidus]|uniref:TadE/TadG family type IV pilus assembly protein n=1 Tax=Vibrio splendidus TaxID=29497 RepID=UPI00080E724E|nr:vWA domain-containing protein [Vibrio splendidus]OCH68830.1 pilus assembly protein TadG [Vibrio splendidus]PMO68209.1 pilus assembly protein TadG [Vibrio splendidus]
MKIISKQRGVAGVIFILCLPILIMTFAFSAGYTQRLLAHSKIEEATEIASLALIANPGGNNQEDKDYAKNLVDLYVTDNINDVEIDVTTTRCEYADGCVQRNHELSPFTDFTVSARTEHKSWITHDEIGVEPEFKVSGRSVTRKFLPQPVDIYFILDTSQSMSNRWSGEKNNKTQMDVVKETIVKVVEDLKTFKTGDEKKSQISLVTYNAYNAKFDKKSNQVKLYDYTREFKHTTKTFEGIVDKMFDQDWPAETTSYAYMYNTSQDIPLTDDYDNFIKLVKSDKLKPATGGGTMSWLGLIAAAKEANKVEDVNRNPEQVFIFLSDGADNKVNYPKDLYLEKTRSYRSKHNVDWTHYSDGSTVLQYQQYLKTLVTKYKLCETLQETISKKKNKFQSKHSSLEGEKTKVTMGVIGVNYIVKEDDGFGDCVGRKNIYHAKKGKDVYKYILNLINEETGRLKD